MSPLQKELVNKYNATRIDDEIIQNPRYENSYIWKNESERRKLVEEFDRTLPQEQRFAIFLHGKLCKYSHSMSGCQFNGCEKDGLIHDWNGYTHAKYLRMAKNALEITDEETIRKLVEVISE